MFSKKRKEEICRQIFIKKVFDDFHNKKLYSRKKLVTNYKQALAIGLSISNKRCEDIKSVKKEVLKDFKVEDMLKLIKTKELIKLVKTDKYSNTKNINELKTKRDVYNKYFNKQKFINKLSYYLKN